MWNVRFFHIFGKNFSDIAPYPFEIFLTPGRLLFQLFFLLPTRRRKFFPYFSKCLFNVFFDFVFRPFFDLFFRPFFYKYSIGFLVDPHSQPKNQVCVVFQKTANVYNNIQHRPGSRARNTTTGHDLKFEPVWWWGLDKKKKEGSGGRSTPVESGNNEKKRHFSTRPHVGFVSRARLFSFVFSTAVIGNHCLFIRLVWLGGG